MSSCPTICPMPGLVLVLVCMVVVLWYGRYAGRAGLVCCVSTPGITPGHITHKVTPCSITEQ